MYKRLHNTELVDVYFLQKVFEHNDVYMRDSVIASQAGVSECDILRVQEVVTELFRS